MNRFEKRPKTSIAVLLLIVLLLQIAATEWFLTTGDDKLLVRGGDSLPVTKRHLALREWLPWSVFEFAAPDIRRTDSEEVVSDTYVLETDRDGFIEPGRLYADADLEIAFLGGSTTECLYVTPTERFPYRVGRMLEEQLGVTVNTLNGAKSGGNTVHSTLTLIGKVLPLKPDIVVLMQNANDLAVLGRAGGYWTDHSDFSLVRRRTRDLESVVKDLRDMAVPQTYRAVRRALRNGILNSASAAEASTTGIDRVRPTAGDAGHQFESALRSFVAIARAWDIQPVLMTQAQIGSQSETGSERIGDYLAEDRLRRRGLTPDEFATAHAYFNAIVRHVAASERIALIELANRPWTRKELYDGLHFTDRGSRMAAEIITEALRDRLQKSETQPGPMPD